MTPIPDWYSIGLVSGEPAFGMFMSAVPLWQSMFLN